jgi:phosphoadenosine phosphosulfate reductase
MEPGAATLTGSVATEELQKVPAFDPEVVAADLEDASAEEALRWALDTFHPRMYIAASFQKTSSVTIHMATQINPETRFFYLDTDVLFPETYETRDRLEERYGISFHRYSSMTLEQQAGLYGDQLWARDPDACCGIRKVDPMRNALSAVDCWVSGIRRQDSQTRANAPKFAWDKRFDLWKLNPLADWSEKDVWRYISENDIPYNALHDQGYPSIGCTHCTRKPAEGEDARAGRWAGTSKTECGLHG